MGITNKKRCSLCVFCLKSTDNSPDACENISKNDQFRFFTLIFRHFLSNGALISEDGQEWCRHACKVISEFTIKDNDNEPFCENVKICNKCEGITRKLSDLYDKLKELELRIDWEVGKLWDVMGCADKVASRLEKDHLEKTPTNIGIVTLGEFRNTLLLSGRAYQEIRKKVVVPNVQLLRMVQEESGMTQRMAMGDIDLTINSVPEGSTVPPNVEENSTQTDTHENITQSKVVNQQLNLPKINDPKVLSMAIIVEEPPLYERNDKVDFEIDSEVFPIISSVRSITPPEVQEYATEPETSAEELIVERDEVHEMDVEFPVHQRRTVKRENDLSPLPLSPSPLPAEPEPPIILQEEDPLSPPKNLQSTYICTTLTCSLSFTSKLKLFQHNMASHIGKYFSSVQPSSLSSDQFNHCITNLLETTLDKFDIVDENYSCNFCSSLFPARLKARNHLVVEHRQILKEKLVELQKPESDPPAKTSEEMENSISTTDAISNATLKRKRGKSKNRLSKFHCARCSRSFSSECWMFQHNMSNHPEKYFISEKLKSLTPHQFQCCVAHMLTTTVDELQTGDSSYQCNLCSKLLSSKQCAKNHLVRKHRSSLKKKLVKLQKSNQSSVVWRLNGKKKKKKKHDHICEICEKVFQLGSHLNQHQRYWHPEIFFESSNLLPSSSAENKEQFKKYVRYVLEKQGECLLSKKGDHDQVKCRICSEVLSSVYIAKSHLISKHRNYLAEKLEEIQKSGKSFRRIEEKLLKMKRTKSSVETGSSLPLACSACPGVSFKNKRILFQHNMTHHVEKYFSSEKEKLNFLSNDQFKNNIIDLLNNTVDEFHKGNSNYECSFCPKLLSARQTSKNHLVTKHRPILKEKLVELHKYGNQFDKKGRLAERKKSFKSKQK